MLRAKSLILRILVVLFTTHVARAVVTPGQQLAVAHISNTANGLAAIKNSLNIQLGYVTIPDFTVISPLFEQYNLTPADVGRTFLVTPQNDPDFNSFVQFLTDGSNEYLGVADDVGGTGAKLESMFWTQRPAGNNGIDLRTFPVGSITMHVDSLTIDSPGSNPNGDGNWTDIFFEGTITVFAIPEPSTLALASIGALIAANRRRIWKKILL